MRKITVAVAALCASFALYGCGPISDEIDVRPKDNFLAEKNDADTVVVTETVTVTEAVLPAEGGSASKNKVTSASVQSEAPVSETSSESKNSGSSNSDSSGGGSSVNSGQNHSDNPPQENRHHEESKHSDEPVKSEEQHKSEEQSQTPASQQVPEESHPEGSQISEETSVPETEIPSKAPAAELPPAPVESNPELKYADGILIVNKSYPVPESYVPELVTAYGTSDAYLTSETNSAYKLMCNDAWAEGYSLWCASGYRSYSLQNRLYTNYAARDGKQAADTYSARPGYSEHQTGLALDLNSIDDSFAYTGEGKWIADNCWRYGFIIRYPKGKEDITGYKYEPWHLRYVGTELAEELYNNGQTLEEYFGLDSKYSD